MDYDKLSNFEINKLVAECLDLSIDSEQYDQDCVVVHGDQFNNGIIEQYTVDYCNNPSDAWPIITENRIALDPPLRDLDDRWRCWFNPWQAFDVNPLRAAMIVFLKMKSEENA